MDHPETLFSWARVIGAVADVDAFSFINTILSGGTFGSGKLKNVKVGNTSMGAGQLWQVRAGVTD